MANANETREVAYKTILDLAVRHANSDSRKPWYLGGDIFKTPPDYRYLELWIDRPIVKGAVESARGRSGETRSEAEIIGLLHIIVKDSVFTAMKDKEGTEALTALLLSAMREGKDMEEWF